MKIGEYLREHPVASVFLAWTGADIVRMGVNLVKEKIHCNHIERVNQQRMDCGLGESSLEYGCSTTADKTDNKATETTEETKAIEGEG